MYLDLNPHTLLTAYANGIFPMADESDRIRWFDPDPRAIIDLDEFKTTRSLRSTIRKQLFDIRINCVFEEVIEACGDRVEGTWISSEIAEAYIKLHRLGFAHSVEAWQDGELAGGLYGVSLGGAFFGESMFHHVTGASKVALVELVRRMQSRGMTLLDIQFVTPHLQRFGAVEIPRDDYHHRLRLAMARRCSFADDSPAFEIRDRHEEPEATDGHDEKDDHFGMLEDLQQRQDTSAVSRENRRRPRGR